MSRLHGSSLRKLYTTLHSVCPLPGYQVHHVDGNPHNNSKENLELVTPEEHIQRHKDLGHKIQNRFILKANSWELLSEERKEEVREKCRISGLRTKLTAYQTTKMIWSKSGGWYCTPTASFISARSAAAFHGCTKKTILDRCKSINFKDWYVHPHPLVVV